MQWLNIAFLGNLASFHSKKIKNGKVERFTITEQIVVNKNK